MTLHIAARDNGETSEVGFYRNSTNQFNRDGIFKDGDFLVHEAATPDNTVKIDIGDIIIGIDSPDVDQPDYYYHGWSTAQESRTVTSNSSGSTRIDIAVAFVDLSVQDATNSDNPGALKIKLVEGTAGSGAPSESDIQTSVGSGNPWVNLAEITAADGFSSITNSEIDDMRPKADTPWRRHNDTVANHVVAGYSTTQVSGLDGQISAGEAYIDDRKVDKPDISHTFSTSVDTYIDLPKTAKPTNTDDFTYTEVSNGANAPTVASGELRIARVVTDASTITSVDTSGEDNQGNKIRPVVSAPSDSVDSDSVDWSTAGKIWWEELGRQELTSASDTLTVSGMTAKNFLYIIIFGDNSGTINLKMNFNDDTAANYARTRSVDGGADAGLADDTEIKLAAASSDSNLYHTCEVTNIANVAKNLHGNTTYQNGGPSSAPSRVEIAAKWNNTSQITKVEVRDDDTGSFDSGSYLIVLGHD